MVRCLPLPSALQSGSRTREQTQSRMMLKPIEQNAVFHWASMGCLRARSRPGAAFCSAVCVQDMGSGKADGDAPGDTPCSDAAPNELVSGDGPCR